MEISIKPTDIQEKKISIIKEALKNLTPALEKEFNIDELNPKSIYLAGIVPVKISFMIML